MRYQRLVLACGESLRKRVPGALRKGRLQASSAARTAPTLVPPPPLMPPPPRPPFFDATLPTGADREYGRRLIKKRKRRRNFFPAGGLPSDRDKVLEEQTMSIVDKVVSAVTPPESDAQRIEATRRARSVAEQGGWLSMALDHHDQIRAALREGLAASPQQRPMAMKRLALVLNGHALAEEVVLYPAMAKAHEKGHANMAYTEQVATKMQMAELERLDPATQDWTDKLEHIEGALLHHMYEEEGTWFIDLLEYEDQKALTQRFREEYTRYTGGDGRGSTLV